MKRVYNIITIASLFVGLLLGFLLPEFSSSIKIIGNVYINILKVLIGPVIFTSIAVSVINAKKGDSKLVLKTIVIFVFMFVATFLLTSLCVGIVSPGSHFTNISEETPSSSADFSVLSILSHLLPSSFEDLIMGKSIFFVIILSFLISLIFKISPIKQEYGKVMIVGKNVLKKALNLIIYVTPLAVISLVSNMVVAFGTKSIDIGLLYVVVAIVCSIIALFVIMILPVWLITKINPFEYIKKASKVWLVSLTTCSSVATLPHTIRVCNEDFGVDERITNIVVPLGCTIHMCGGAVSFSLLGLFVAQMSGTPVTIPMFLLMVLSATLINMAAPGIPGGGKVIGFTYLSLLGLPIDTFYGIYVAIYSVLDMAYTTLNVTGDISANILLNHFRKMNEA